MNKVLLKYFASCLCKQHQTGRGTETERLEDSWKAEAILLESYRRANDSANQAKGEINNTFYIYLVLASIIGAGLTAVQGLVFQATQQQYLYLPAVFTTTTGFILLLTGLVSLLFLERFLQLAKEQYKNIKTMNELQDFYLMKIDGQNQTKKEFTSILTSQHGNEIELRVPFVIWFTVVIGGSLYCGGAAGILTQHLLTFSIFIGFSVLVFVFMFLVSLLYYFIRKSWLSKA